MIKKYQVIYKFSDVIDTIEAETEEEAQQIAEDRAYNGKDYCPLENTSCYEVEVEEIKGVM